MSGIRVALLMGGILSVPLRAPAAPPAAPDPRPTLVFSLDQGFGSGFVPNYDDVALDRIVTALQPLQPAYRVCILVNPQVSAREKFDALLDALAARRLPFAFDVYSSDGHTLGCWDPPNKPHDVRHGVTISVEELGSYRRRYGPWLAGLRIMEVFAHDFTIRAVKTTNPEWGNPHWVNPDDDFFQPGLAEPFLRFARDHGMFVQWSDWHWNAFADWDKRQKPYEDQMAGLLRKYPGLVTVTYANNEPAEKSEDRFDHWEKSVSHFVEAGAAGYGLSDQSWLRKDHMKATPEDIVRWADGAFDRGCRFVQFEPMWFFFAWCVGTAAVQDPRQDPTWEARGTPTPAFRRLAEALTARAAKRDGGAPKGPAPEAAFGDAVIRGEFKGRPLVVTATARLAGAIHSLTWDGREFVDSLDHGRQIQTAWSVNDLGQCYNPTEAGSAADGAGASSTTVLLACETEGAALRTRCRPAFWIAPGVQDAFGYFDPSAPNPPWRGGPSVNRTKAAEWVLEKDVRVGAGGLPNVIEYVSRVTVPARTEVPVQCMVMEHPAVYMPVAFSAAHRYDPAAKKRTTLPSPFYGYAPQPAILATPDGAHALGLYTPDMAPGGYPDHRQAKYLGYEVIDWTTFGKCMLLGARLPRTGPKGGAVPAGTQTFRTYLALGTLADVEAAIDRLYGLHPPAEMAK